MMKNFFFGLFFAAILFLVIKAFAGEPGSASDPVVTKSFLEEAYAWRLTTVPSGEKLTLDLGSEAILRSGKAVVSGSESGGLSDLTSGQDLGDSVEVPLNHYLVSPSAEGRGVKALTTSVFLTRGLVH